MDKKYFIIIAIFFINFMGLTSLVFSIKLFFIPELIVLSLFLISSVIIMYNLYHNRKGVWIMSLLFFAAYLINTTFLYFYSQNQALFVLLILTTVIGFIMSVENIRGRTRVRSKYEKEIMREAEELTKAEEELPDLIVEEVKPSKQFVKTKIKKKKITKKSLKKYVASRKGVNYHEPGCRWARKILPKRKIFFKNKKEAEEEGFKPCKCVK